jgi:hypothetical protein
VAFKPADYRAFNWKNIAAPSAHIIIARMSSAPLKTVIKYRACPDKNQGDHAKENGKHRNQHVTVQLIPPHNILYQTSLNRLPQQVHSYSVILKVGASNMRSTFTALLPQKGQVTNHTPTLKKVSPARTVDFDFSDFAAPRDLGFFSDVPFDLVV